MRKRMSGGCLIAMLFIAACDGGNPPSPSVAASVAENMVYSRDSRSDLCFGSVTSQTSDLFWVVSVTNVPCERVEHLIVELP